MSQPPRTQPSIPNHTVHGCTCGHCAGGWLCPRMSYQLQGQANFALVAMYKNPDECTFDMNVDPSVVAMLPYSEYLPRAVFGQTLHPGFYGGYTAVFRSVLDILKRVPAVPLTADAVKAHALANYPQVVEHFFAQGGQVVYALDAITGMAKDESEHGEFDKSGAAYAALPQCDKDYDFGLVRKKAGLSANRRWGPY